MAERDPLRAFWIALAAGWVLLAVAGLLYARAKGIPEYAARPVMAALLLEYPFYLLAGFAAAREALRRWLPGARLAPYLAASAVIPYLAYAVPSGQFRWGALASLAALALALALWYEVLPAAPAADVGLLALLAAVLLRGYFQLVYTPPYAKLDVTILGHLALYHVTALAILNVRGAVETPYGFWPRRAEWIAGIRQFILFLPIGFPLGLLLKAIHFGAAAPALWKVAGTFLGILWVVALFEEFVFRGLLQQWLSAWLGRPQVALVLTSLLFGAVHLPFRGFPNWRFAMVAAVAGYFYGRAFNQTKSIRASMVTHALVVTVWRAVFV